MPQTDVPDNPAYDHEWADLNQWYTFEDVGDTLVGTYLGAEKFTMQDKRDGSDKEMYRLNFLTENGLAGCIMSAQLRRLLYLPPGVNVHISYDGKDGNVKMFTVRIARAAFENMCQDTMRRIQAGTYKAPELPAVSNDADPFVP